MKALIFGINGQDGFYLNQVLSNNKIEVVGVSRSNGNWITGNVADYSFVEAIIKLHQPEYVFHLAANSTTQHDALFENHETISTGTLNVLEATNKFSPQSKIFISGSALQFVNKGKPISENDPFEARDAYSVSRIQSVYAARYYRSLGIKVYVGYFFHHDSPIRSERHLNMKIAKATLRINEGNKEILEIGNVDIIKEYNYAGDVMAAIWLLISQDIVFESVIGSGNGYAIKDWIKICFDIIEKDWHKYVRTKNDYKPEFISLVSNPATLLSLGWKPSVDIYQLAKKMMTGTI